ncbi:MAG: argininosuccinate lyase [Gammaproteobacteria bacterium]|nr:argininosuccinate lyase [Gammaproteobacteria bacterium]
MNRFKKFLLSLGLSTGIVYFGLITPVAVAGDQDFTLINDTGVEIHRVYTSPHSTDEWEEDVLGDETLGDGESLDISFSPKEKAALWDLRVEDEDGNSIVWENLNLLEISEVTLHYKKGKAWADLE